MKWNGINYRLRIEARLDNPRWIGVVSSVFGILFALIVGGFVLKAAGASDPIGTYQFDFQRRIWHVCRLAGWLSCMDDEYSLPERDVVFWSAFGYAW